MELCNLGKNCTFKSCHQLDFLPIKCDYCKLIFCNLHNSPNSHQCSSYKELTGLHGNQQLTASDLQCYMCSIPDCKNGELTPVICSGCNKNFCLLHRHMTDHGCSCYVAPINPMAIADQKIQELTSNLSSNKPPRKTAKNDKLAAKINLMKMKGKAVGNKKIPEDERIYFSITLPKSLKKSTILPVFISMVWSVGRAIDAIAELTDVKNMNNESLTSFLGLFKLCDGFSILPLDGTIQSLIEKEALYSGQSLIMEYGPRGLEHLKDYDGYYK